MPLSSSGSAAVRATAWTGLSKRRISSIAFGIRLGSSRRICHWSGWRSSDRNPLPIRFTVVSCPAREQQADIGPQFGGGQAVAGFLGLHQLGDQVVLRIRAAPGRTAPRNRRRIHGCRDWRCPVPSRVGGVGFSSAPPEAEPVTKRAWSSSGMPSSSQMTSTGSGNARSRIASIRPCGTTLSSRFVGQVLHPFAHSLDPAGGEGFGDQSAQAGVIGRIAHQHHVRQFDNRRFVAGRSGQSGASARRGHRNPCRNGGPATSGRCLRSR